MTQSFFFDSSALIKLYHMEAGTDQAEMIFNKKENTIIISELATVEVYSTLARKVRIKEITPDAQKESLKNFDDDCGNRFVVEPLSSLVIQKAKNLLSRYGNTRALRTLDSLQLGACLAAGVREEVVFVCADANLLAINQLEGIQVLNPEVAEEG